MNGRSATIRRKTLLMMTPAEFKQALRTLDLTQEDFGALVGSARRTAVYWAASSVPGPVATLVRLLLARPELVGVLREMAGVPQPETAHKP